jgi:hypothetical protein
VVLAVFEFLVFGVYGHSLFWGVVFALLSVVVVAGVLLFVSDLRNRRLLQWTRLDLSEGDLHVQRAETDLRYKWTHFDTAVLRDDTYVLVSRTKGPPGFFVIQTRLFPTPDAQRYLREVLNHHGLTVD